MILAPSKMDALADPETVEALRRIAVVRGMQFIPISSVTGAGMDELLYAMSAVVFESASSMGK
jgi:translation initiation factor IF-2